MQYSTVEILKLRVYFPPRIPVNKLYIPISNNGIFVIVTERIDLGMRILEFSL